MILRIFTLCLSTLFLPLITVQAYGQSSTSDTINSYAAETKESFANLDLAELALSASLIEKGETIKRGLVWRIYRQKSENKDSLSLIATAKGGSALLSLPPDSYLVHASFGRAGATKRIILNANGTKETFVLQAGGLQLNATALDQKIPAKDLYFSIYEQKQDENGERKLIALNASANKVIRLNEGTYHVLSRYGKVNATVRADLQVKAGKITKALLQHRGAAISLRLVRKAGGDPIANTAWTIFTQDGEVVFNSHSVAPSLILAEGSYEANVKNGERNFKKGFEVKTGKNIQVELIIE